MRAYRSRFTFGRNWITTALGVTLAVSVTAAADCGRNSPEKMGPSQESTAATQTAPAATAPEPELRGPVIDETLFDVDADGVRETCTLSYGPTSGLFTFVLSVSEDGKQEYANTFLSDPYTLCFVQRDGTLLVRRESDPNPGIPSRRL